MLNLNPSQFVNFWPMIVLIFQFWLSGLWILSLIFIIKQTSQMEHTNFFMFITLGIGSLAGGYASDILGRVFVFKIGSVIWTIGALVALFSEIAGYIITAGCIGLLNNLTFVLIMEHFPHKKDTYTIYVLIGWAVSQITLGLLFYLIKTKQYYFLLLFVLTFIYTIAVFLYIEQPNKNNAENIEQNQIIHQNLTNSQQNILENQENIPWHKKILPHSLKPLIGGCILMFVMQMFYYRTQFTLDLFGISLQLNTIVVGLTQLLANVVFTRLIDRYPRKVYLRLFLIILTFLFLILVVMHNKIVQTLVEGIMRLFDTFIMIILGVYLPELFSMNERGKGTNYVMFFGVLGSALNSIILNSFKFWQLIFFLIIGFLSTFLFKETLFKNTSNINEEVQKQRENL